MLCGANGRADPLLHQLNQPVAGVPFDPPNEAIVRIVRRCAHAAQAGTLWGSVSSRAVGLRDDRRQERAGKRLQRLSRSGSDLR